MIPVKQQLTIRHVLAYPIRDSALQSELHRSGSTTFNYSNKVIGVLNTVKLFQSSIDATTTWYQNLNQDSNPLSGPECYGDLVYKFRQSVGRNYFSEQFRKITIRYKSTGYNMRVMRQTACLVVNPISDYNFSALLNCTPVGWTSDLIINWCLRSNNLSSWLDTDDLPLIEPIGVQLLNFCCSRVSVLVLLCCWVPILFHLVLCLLFGCTDALKVLHADRITCMFMNHSKT